MTDWNLRILELDLKKIEKEKEIAEYHLKHDTQKETDEYGFEIVQSGSGYAVIMPNGIRLSKSKCVPYKSLKIDENGIISNGKTKLPITLSELQKFSDLIDTFPKSGNKERAVWCNNHFGRHFSYEVIIFNLFIRTFDEYLKPVIELVE